MPWSREQRKLAKDASLSLVSLAVDNRTNRGKPGGAFSFDGPADRATADRVMAFITALLKERSARQKRLKKE